MTRDRVLEICCITKHQYYKRPHEVARRGRKCTSMTYKIIASDQLIEVANEEVITSILEIKSDPETDYGYRAMSAALQMSGYIINHKKVYRLMQEYQLLNDRRKMSGKTYVKYSRVTPEGPLEVLEMDIKFQWVNEHHRYAFILTVIDCFTRKVLHWTVAYSIKQEQVKEVWEYIIARYLQSNEMLKKGMTIEVRNDNDSRFAAMSVQSFFKDNHLNQVFTHPYTPQENGHIESFHSILSRSLKCKEFATIMQLEKHLQHFYKVYNSIRLHGSLDHLSPNNFWRLWNAELINRKELKNRKVRFQLKIPHYLLSGNGNLREVSSSLEERIKEVIGANSLQQPSVQRSPSVVSS